ncbi:MAG: S8 family serine peptidase [Candidatus Aureabacteria bacterium]|nr:S8 family serine peptidase [Candidatus Auribacterota bacterium]
MFNQNAQSSASFTADPNAMVKLAPWVVENTEGGAEAEFLVVFADQADLSGAADFSTRVEKGMYVFDTLRGKAIASQQPLLDWLAARGIEHRSFYIINAVWVKGDRDIALALAGRNEVWRIEGNPMIYNELPSPSGRSQSNSLSAIESNITYVRAPEVWALGHTGEGIVVGGQDTGYQWDHPALKGKYRGWNGSSANHDYNWHDSIHSGGGVCGPNSTVPCDDDQHGTHTMGTVLGDDGAGNQIGMAPGAKWIGCRNMDQGNGTPATYLECFEFFLAPYPVGGSPAQGDPAKAPDVTNNSWGCPVSEGCSSGTLQTAVEAQRAAGIMTVVSAGNDGSSCSTVQDPPAIYDASYSVGALNKGFDTIASFSSRGPVTVDGSNRRKPDISAPGTNIRSSVPGSGYEGGWSGTSMAGPHVAGAVALLWSARPELKNQIDSTEYVLSQSAIHISSSACSSSGWPNNVFGYGRLDVRSAIDQETPTITPTAAPSNTPTITATPEGIPTSTPTHTPFNTPINTPTVTPVLPFALMADQPKIAAGEVLNIAWSFHGMEYYTDVYFGVQLPTGELLAMGVKGNFGSKIVPVASDFNASGDPHGVLILPIPPNTPSGVYIFEAVCVLAGAPVTSRNNWLTDIVSVPVIIQ